MEVSLRPRGGLLEMPSPQSLVPALRRMVFLQSLTLSAAIFMLFRLLLFTSEPVRDS